MTGQRLRHGALGGSAGEAGGTRRRVPAADGDWRPGLVAARGMPRMAIADVFPRPLVTHPVITPHVSAQVRPRSGHYPGLTAAELRMKVRAHRNAPVVTGALR